MKFTKRMLGLLLTAIMVLQLVPINILTVSAAEDLRIVAEKTNLTIYEEQKLSVSGTVSGEAEWSSSDPGVVSVDAQGKIKGLKAGTATVTLSVNGAAIDSIAITVSPLTNYRLKRTSGTVTFADGIER